MSFQSPFITPKRLAYPRQDGQESPSQGLGTRPENSKVSDLTSAEKIERRRDQNRKAVARHRQKMEELEIREELAAEAGYHTPALEKKERRREQSRQSSARYRQKQKLLKQQEELATPVRHLTPAEKQKRLREQWRKNSAKYRQKKKDLEAIQTTKHDLQSALLMQLNNVDDGVEKQREVYGKEDGVIASATKEKSSFIQEYKKDSLALSTPGRPYSQKREASEMLSSGLVPTPPSVASQKMPGVSENDAMACAYLGIPRKRKAAEMLDSGLVPVGLWNNERSSKKIKSPPKVLFSPKPVLVNPVQLTGKSLSKFQKFLETIPEALDGKKLSAKNEAFLKGLVDSGKSGIGKLHEQVEGKVPSQVYELVDCLVSSLDPNSIEVECRKFLHHLLELFLEGSNDEESVASDNQAPKELLERIESLTEEVEAKDVRIHELEKQVALKDTGIEGLEADNRLKDQQIRRYADHLDRLLRENGELRRGQR